MPGSRFDQMISKKTHFGNREVEEDEKPVLVRDVFSRVSHRYDLMNDAMSMGIHRFWKDTMVDWLAPVPGQRILDLAGGTGDIAARILHRAPESEITVLDLTVGMIDNGRRRFASIANGEQVAWVVGDAMAIPCQDGSFDRCTLGFGIRNFRNIPGGLEEIHRVLRIGGRVVILEFSKVRNAWLRRFYDWYSFGMIPRMGMVLAGDRESYLYLVESIRRFPGPEQFKQQMRDAGFGNVKHRSLSAGVATVYSGWKL